MSSERNFSKVHSFDSPQNESKLSTKNIGIYKVYLRIVYTGFFVLSFEVSVCTFTCVCPCVGLRYVQNVCEMQVPLFTHEWRLTYTTLSFLFFLNKHKLPLAYFLQKSGNSLSLSVQTFGSLIET